MTGLDWPVVRRYRGAALTQLRMPVGGIGTGCISLGGRGQLVDWQLFNRPSMGFDADAFFALRVHGPGVDATRLLERELTDAELAGPHGSSARWHGLPRFRDGEFAAAYPFGQVTLSDPDVPVEVTVGAFNPLVPGAADDSGLPVLVQQVRVTNVSPGMLRLSFCASMQNVVGARQARGGWRLPDGGTFTLEEQDLATVLLGKGASDPADPADPAEAASAGTLALAVAGRASSTRRGWAKRSWGDSLLEFWDDLTADGELAEPEEMARVPIGSLVQSRDVGAGASTTFTAVIAWHFPHRQGWAGLADGPPTYSAAVDVGNHYTSRFADAADVVRQVLPRLPELAARTEAFVRTLTDSDVPPAIADAALSNLAVLRTPVCFRIADGTFLGWEGQNADTGSCHGSCTHVWNYQYALEGLFPELAWTMREVEFVHSLDQRGRMSFRVGLPFATHGTSWPTAAADGQMGAVVRLFRTYRADPDLARLRTLWPGVRRAIEFAWIPDGWDADRDGLMEGCQHNTMDVEYYGPSGVNQSWYLAALAAAVELARAVGDTDFAATCAQVLTSGARLTDEVLFNGEYYQQDIRPPGSADRIAEGLRIRYEGDVVDAGSEDLVEPDLQIGPGCGSDQLVGHTMATLSGLEVPLRADHVTSALDAVFRHNHRDDLHGHLNHLRTFAAGDEAALLNCTYPRGGRPRRPFPYCNEVWTGLEYSAAIGLLLAGRRSAALRIVQDVRDRYDGRRRNPFDEVECGHHYVRSMASWGLVEAWRTTTGRGAGEAEATVPPRPGNDEKSIPHAS